MKRFLFQGDSITDGDRNRNLEDVSSYEIGHSYATITAGTLGLKHPGELEFFNRAISGNRIVDLYARIKKDIINLKPDYLSILIGVNDVWHELEHQNGVSAEKFEKVYSLLIEEIKEELPETKIYILEPYTLPDFPRISSATSGFFFWGIMELPVEQESSISTNENSLVFQSMSSSQKRLRCIMHIERAEESSITKSLSDTPSNELRVIASNPSSSATICLSSG